MKSVVCFVLAASIGALVVSCGGNVDTEGEGGAGGGSSPTTTSSGGGSPTTSSMGPTSVSTPASSSTGGAGEDCASKPDPLACFGCCLSNYSAGAAALRKAQIAECACKDASAVCNADCADNVCAEKTLTKACNDCLGGKASMDKCLNAVVVTCQADKDCKAYTDCFQGCSTM